MTNLSSRIRLSTSASRGAFTLIEMIVVIGLIVLLIGLAVPAFRVLSGSRSTENAVNMISSGLSRARADAIGVQQVKGIAIYRELATDRLAIRLVEGKSIAPYVAGTTGSPRTYTRGTYVKDGSLPTPNYFICTATYSDTASPASAPSGPNWKGLANDAQILASEDADPLLVDTVPDRDRILLAIGLDARGVGNFSGNVNTFYMSPVVILFDASGAVTARSYRILPDGELGSVANTSSWPGVGSAAIPATPESRGQVGLMLFDQEEFNNNSGSATYIDQNGAPLLVNRYNGTLVKGE